MLLAVVQWIFCPVFKREKRKKENRIEFCQQMDIETFINYSNNMYFIWTVIEISFLFFFLFLVLNLDAIHISRWLASDCYTNSIGTEWETSGYHLEWSDFSLFYAQLDFICWPQICYTNCKSWGESGKNWTGKKKNNKNRKLFRIFLRTIGSKR